MRTLADIVGLLAQRRADRGGMLETARMISKRYNNAVPVPLPTIAGKQDSAVANFIAQGIDQHSMRIASVPYEVSTFPLTTSDASKERAKARRQSCYGWMEQNALNLVQRKRARHYVAYASSPVYIGPNKATLGPKWEVKSPLDTYPAPTTDSLDMRPDDCMWVYDRTWRWLSQRYPSKAAAVAAIVRRDSQPKADDPLELVQYVDADEFVVVALGTQRVNANIKIEAEYGIGDARIVALSGSGGKTWAVELSRSPNLAKICPVVIPGRINLDRPKGQFDDTPGLAQMLETLMALDVEAVARSVFPEKWVVKEPSGSGEIVVKADGLKGVIGEIEGGRIDTVQLQPGFQTGPTMDRLERALRQNGAIPAEYGGESPTNVRTDRRGQSVVSASVDWHIDEAQQVFAASAKAEFEVAARVEMAYYGGQRKAFYVKWGKSPGWLKYTPNDVWSETQDVLVDYPFSGMDENARTVAIGQKLGLRTMSRETAMRSDPAVFDVELEVNRVASNAIDDALVQQLMQPGAMTVPDLARIKQLLRDPEVSIEDAIVTAQQEAQARQATTGPPGTPEAPAEPGSPEAQPGLAPPGAGQEAGTVQAPPAGLDNLRNLLGDLKGGNVLTGARFNG